MGLFADAKATSTIDAFADLTSNVKTKMIANLQKAFTSTISVPYAFSPYLPNAFSPKTVWVWNWGTNPWWPLVLLILAMGYMANASSTNPPDVMASSYVGKRAMMKARFVKPSEFAVPTWCLTGSVILLFLYLLNDNAMQKAAAKAQADKVKEFREQAVTTRTREIQARDEAAEVVWRTRQEAAQTVARVKRASEVQAEAARAAATAAEAARIRGMENRWSGMTWTLRLYVVCTMMKQNSDMRQWTCLALPGGAGKHHWLWTSDEKARYGFRCLRLFIHPLHSSPLLGVRVWPQRKVKKLRTFVDALWQDTRITHEMKAAAMSQIHAFSTAVVKEDSTSSSSTSTDSSDGDDDAQWVKKHFPSYV